VDTAICTKPVGDLAAQLPHGDSSQRGNFLPTCILKCATEARLDAKSDGVQHAIWPAIANQYLSAVL
jgi:hypothetical protein